MTSKRIPVLAVAILMAVTVVSAQKPLGPKDRDTILDSKLDPSFASTPLTKLVLLPFGNELDYPEGAMFLAQNFVSEMQQKHPEITVVAPAEALELIKKLNLATEYRVFWGNYVNTGVPTLSFLKAFGQAGRVDGILLGQVLGFGVVINPRILNTPLGLFKWNKSEAVVGMEIRLLRCKDGRELWWGAHAVKGAKNENVKDLAKVVGGVFASYFGRVPY